MEKVEKAEKDLETLKNRGETFHTLGKFEEAIKCFQRILETNPQDAQVWRGHGYALYNLNRYEEAIESFKKALVINPNDRDSWRSQGYAYYHLNNLKESVESFKRALSLDTNDAVSWHSLGHALYTLKKYEEAEECFKTALSFNPKDVDTWRDRGNNFFAMALYEKAEQAYQEALKLKPKDVLSWKNRGKCLYLLGRFYEAEENLYETLDLNTRDAEAWQYRGKLLHMLDRKEEEEESFKHALSLMNNDALTLRYQGFNFYNDGRFEDALEKFKKAHETNPNDSQAQEASAFIKRKLQNLTTPLENIIFNVNAKIGIRKDDVHDSLSRKKKLLDNFLDTEKSISYAFPSFLSVLKSWLKPSAKMPFLDYVSEGGFFLYYNKKGLVINPNVGFIENFYSEGFRVADIDMILVTDNNKNNDLEKLLTLLENYNKMNRTRKEVVLFLVGEISLRYADFLSKLKVVKSTSILWPDREQFISDGIKFKALSLGDSGMGFVLTLGTSKKILFMENTSWNDTLREKLRYEDSELVIAQIGEISEKEFLSINKQENEKEEFYNKNSLGVAGLISLCNELNRKNKEKLVLISDFPFDFVGTEKMLLSLLNSEFDRLTCLPLERGLHLKVEDFSLYSSLEGQKTFLPYKDVSFEEHNKEVVFYEKNKETEKLTPYELWKKKRTGGFSYRLNYYGGYNR